jgi:hypothetical protein
MSSDLEPSHASVKGREASPSFGTTVLHTSLEVKAACSSETSVSAYKATRCYNPEDHNVNSHCPENLNVCIFLACLGNLSIQYTVLLLKFRFTFRLLNASYQLVQQFTIL